MTTRILMHGASGRMGQTILGLAAANPAFDIAAGIDQKPGTLRDLGIASEALILDRLPVEPGAVLIDFSHHSAFKRVVEHCANHGMAYLGGTTGVPLTEADPVLAAAAARIPVILAMNMSVGVNVLLKTAASLAKALGPDYDIEIVEAHHHFKKDAPSGTAYAIADAITGATGRTRADLVHGREGDVGARTKGEIGMHALRMGDVVGDHTVYFVGGGERILLGHVAHNREIFANGALRAAAWLSGRAPGRYTMADVLGL